MTKRILIFDGDCVLCSANAHFVLNHDKRGVFHLGPMQGATGCKLLKDAGLDPQDPTTLLLIESDGRLRRNSDAVLAIGEALGWPWRLATMARIIPAPLRDVGYRWVARNRYRLFGKQKQCFVPRAEWKDRIL